MSAVLKYFPLLVHIAYTLRNDTCGCQKRTIGGLEEEILLVS